jgi:hypothetical protein
MEVSARLRAEQGIKKIGLAAGITANILGVLFAWTHRCG